jgi:hypothetical protein
MEKKYEKEFDKRILPDGYVDRAPIVEKEISHGGDIDLIDFPLIEVKEDGKKR